MSVKRVMRSAVSSLLLVVMIFSRDVLAAAQREHQSRKSQQQQQHQPRGGDRCKDSKLPACEALNNWHSPRHKPDLIQSMKQFSAVLKKDEEDWVLWEHLGATMSMVARRLLNNPDGTPATAGDEAKGMEVLKQAVQAFVKGHKVSVALLSGREKKDQEKWLAFRKARGGYPQQDYALPLTSTLRAWGDALAWLNRPGDAEKVFALGVKAKIWKSPVCRATPELPTRPYLTSRTSSRISDEDDEAAARQQNHPFVWKDLSLFEEVFGLEDIERALMSDLISEYENVNWEANREEQDNNDQYRPESGGLHTGKKWSQLPLIVDGQPRNGGCSLFPKFCSRLKSIPAIHLKSGQVKFSRMKNGTVVRPHAGPVNSRLRMHCGIAIPTADDYKKETNGAVLESWIRIGSVNTSWTPSKCFVFDESCEHEVVFQAHHHSSIVSDRVVLILDFANPFLAEEKSYVDAHTVEFQEEARFAYRKFQRAYNGVSSSSLPCRDDL